MIRLNLHALSDEGKAVTDSLKESEPALNQCCSCPPGESCFIEVIELPGTGFEAIVVRPGPVKDSHEWAIHEAVTGMYRRVFDGRAGAGRIRDAVAFIVSAALAEKRNSAAAHSGADGLCAVFVDVGTLRQAQSLIVGCQVCSPFYAEIPFDSILDRVTGNNPAMTRYVLPEGAARCPRCRRHLHENTLVEFEPLFRQESDFEE